MKKIFFLTLIIIITFINTVYGECRFGDKQCYRQNINYFGTTEKSIDQIIRQDWDSINKDNHWDIMNRENGKINIVDGYIDKIKETNYILTSDYTGIQSYINGISKYFKIKKEAVNLIKEIKNNSSYKSISDNSLCQTNSITESMCKQADDYLYSVYEAGNLGPDATSEDVDKVINNFNKKFENSKELSDTVLTKYNSGDNLEKDILNCFFYEKLQTNKITQKCLDAFYDKIINKGGIITKYTFPRNNYLSKKYYKEGIQDIVIYNKAMSGITYKTSNGGVYNWAGTDIFADDGSNTYNFFLQNSYSNLSYNGDFVKNYNNILKVKNFSKSIYTILSNYNTEKYFNPYSVLSISKFKEKKDINDYCPIDYEIPTKEDFINTLEILKEDSGVYGQNYFSGISTLNLTKYSYIIQKERENQYCNIDKKSNACKKETYFDNKEEYSPYWVKNNTNNLELIFITNELEIKSAGDILGVGKVSFPRLNQGNVRCIRKNFN